MNKTDFLQHEDVSQFIAWLIERLPRIEFRLAFSRSRFVPDGLVDNVTGIEQVLQRYVWRTSWKDNGEIIRSDDWGTTRRSLQGLRDKLHAAADAGDDNAMLAACLSVLEWGGVSGARPFLRRKAAKGQLVKYLCDVRAALELDRNRDIGNIDHRIIERYDAGLTKIHALFDTTGLPIYDSRVGAAIAMLYAMYRAEAGANVPRATGVLTFPSGGARGVQIRDPKALDGRFPPAPQFYTAGVTHVFWAQSQVKLGWIIQEVLMRTGWFLQDGGDLPARCHAFEAALFMVGYDLRCLSDERRLPMPDPGPAPRPSGTTWVPTGHDFKTVFPLYVDYRKDVHARGALYDDAPATGFIQWQGVHAPQYAGGTPRNNCFPFRQTEFDLFERPLDEIGALRDAVDADDTAAISGFLGDFAMQSDERRNVCLVDAWCVGYLTNQGFDRVRSLEILVAAGFAGTPNSAATLWSVGGNVGGYLKLLDKDKHPTPLFHDYFADKLSDLGEQLKAVM